MTEPALPLSAAPAALSTTARTMNAATSSSHPRRNLRPSAGGTASTSTVRRPSAIKRRVVAKPLLTRNSLLAGAAGALAGDPSALAPHEAQKRLSSRSEAPHCEQKRALIGTSP